MLIVIQESVLDVLKTVPILVMVYALMYFLETRMRSTPALLEKAQQLGPCVGALAGVVPQCGFSAAASALYNSGYLAPATLVAVFLSTSDEALPVLLSNPEGAKSVVLLIACKLVLAIVGGYILQATVFRGERKNFGEQLEITISDGSGCCGSSIMGAVVWRTIKTTLFLLLTMTAINIVVAIVGEDTLATVLLSGSLLQPALCAFIGLIPGCAVSVLLCSLFLNGTIGFGGVLAGLATGAGFGYVMLLQRKAGKRRAFKIIAATYAVAVVGGTLAQILMQ